MLDYIIASPGVLRQTRALILMPLKKAMLFIDCSNFYHCLKQNKLFDFFSYKSFYDELSKGFEVSQVLFYDATKSFLIEPEQFSKQQAFHERLKKEIPNLIIRARKLKYLFVNERVENAKKKAKFCKNCKKALEDFIADAGLLKISKEKGVDILLVADMIKYAYQDRYEVALLATGDADFTPAVELVQALKKEVVNLHFFAGSSSELRNACNSHKLIQVDAQGKCYFR